MQRRPKSRSIYRPRQERTLTKPGLVHWSLTEAFLLWEDGDTILRS